MIDPFLFVGLPYIAVVVCIVGFVWRMRQKAFTMSSRSSQFLEDRQLLFGSMPWHIGIFVVLLGHIVAGLLPRVWSSILSVPGALFAVEALGVACSLLALFGLGMLIFRRVTSAKVQAVTTTMDLVVAAILFVQILVGLLSSINYRYGAVWSTGTVVPYFWGLMTLRPDVTYVSGFPALFKLHLVGAWLLILLVPFTRLAHVLMLPLHYIWHAPQLVVWSNARRQREAFVAANQAESRRQFLKGAAGLAGATGLMALGVSEKTVNYFKGPRGDAEAETALLAKKLQRLQKTAEERELELERQRSNLILVARYTDLDPTKGKYFIDYTMAPGLAYKGKDGLPILISAKCTHLGCTVSSDLDAQGRVMCPCHVSYFDIVTGKPNEGAPAKKPLPHIDWALVDATGKPVVSKRAGMPVQGSVTPELLPQLSLYITKPSTDIV